MRQMAPSPAQAPAMTLKLLQHWLTNQTVNGFTVQVLKLDLDGKVLAAVGKPGNGVGEFGEAHFVAVSPKGEIYVADSVNRAVQKFVKK